MFPKGRVFILCEGPPPLLPPGQVTRLQFRELLGHADLQMATRYVQDVSAQTDRVIENSRMYICQFSK